MTVTSYRFSFLLLRTEMVPQMLVCVLFYHLTWLVAPEFYWTQSHESFRSYIHNILYSFVNHFNPFSVMKKLSMATLFMYYQPFSYVHTKCNMIFLNFTHTKVLHTVYKGNTRESIFCTCLCILHCVGLKA